MQTTNQNYEPINDYVCQTADIVTNHLDASPELKTAMNEFRKKSSGLQKNFATANVKRNAIEIEQAADSALYVARASEAPTGLTKKIRSAHDQIRDFKRNILS